MIQNWFSRFPDDLSRSAADVLKSMQSAGEPFKDSERRDFTFVFGKFHSIQFAEAILAALKSSGMLGVADLYTGKGIDLSLDESQAFLTGLGNAQPQLKELCDELKRCGVRPQTKWQEVCGESPLPTIEEVAAAQAAVNVVPEFDQHSILLMANIKYAVKDGNVSDPSTWNGSFVFHAQELATVNGQDVAGASVVRFAVTGGLSDQGGANQQMIDSIKATIRSRMEEK